MFKDFGKRLQRDLKSIVSERIQLSERLSGLQSTGVDVQVISHKNKETQFGLVVLFSSDIRI